MDKPIDQAWDIYIAKYFPELPENRRVWYRETMKEFLKESELRNVLLEKIREWEGERFDSRRMQGDIYDRACKEKDAYKKSVLVYLLELEKEVEKHCAHEINKWTWLKDKVSGKVVAELNIPRAKEFPITEILDNHGVKGEQAGKFRVKYLCPLHIEKTASMVVFTKENRWYCFAGCGGGDSIDLVMKLDQLPFNEAVTKLL